MKSTMELVDVLRDEGEDYFRSVFELQSVALKMAVRKYHQCDVASQLKDVSRNWQATGYFNVRYLEELNLAVLHSVITILESRWSGENGTGS